MSTAHNTTSVKILPLQYWPLFFCASIPFY